MIRIASTETYEPSFLIDKWKHRYNEFDFVLFVTKSLTHTLCSMLVEDDSNWNFSRKASILHVTATGWGASPVEPGVPELKQTVMKVRDLIRRGYPAERIVWRIDPIIPTIEGISRFASSVDAAREHGIKRIRSSVMQMYDHARERLEMLPELYSELSGIYQGRFMPYPDNMEDAISRIREVVRENPDISFESCCSRILEKCEFNTSVGCVSEKDLLLNGFSLEQISTVQKGQQRYSCLCLQKQQLIPGGMSYGRCPNKCAYCYLKDSVKKEEKPQSVKLF